jgi:hypothetical protein
MCCLGLVPHPEALLSDRALELQATIWETQARTLRKRASLITLAQAQAQARLAPILTRLRLLAVLLAR